MSSSAPVVTSVSTLTIDVMESLTAVIAQMSKAVVSIQIFPLAMGLITSSMYNVTDTIQLEFRTNVRLFIYFFQLLDLQGCAIMRLSFSASQTGAVSRLPGSVMVIQTAKTAAMNTTPAHLAPALPHSSVAIMETACYRAGFVMGTTTAGI